MTTGVSKLNFAWTLSGNYPAGGQPWSGTPIRVTPATLYFTPDTKPPAQNFNDILADIVADLQATQTSS